MSALILCIFLLLQGFVLFRFWYKTDYSHMYTSLLKIKVLAPNPLLMTSEAEHLGVGDVLFISSLSLASQPSSFLSCFCLRHRFVFVTSVVLSCSPTHRQHRPRPNHTTELPPFTLIHPTHALPTRFLVYMSPFEGLKSWPRTSC